MKPTDVASHHMLGVFIDYLWTIQANQKHFLPLLFELVGILHNPKPWNTSSLK